MLSLACVQAGELWSKMVSQHYSELKEEGEEKEEEDEGNKWQIVSQDQYKHADLSWVSLVPSVHTELGGPDGLSTTARNSTGQATHHASLFVEPFPN